MRTLFHFTAGPGFYAEAVKHFVARMDGWRHVGVSHEEGLVMQRCRAIAPSAILGDLNAPNVLQILREMNRLSGTALVISFERLRDWHIFELNRNGISRIVSSRPDRLHELRQALKSIEIGSAYLSPEWSDASRDFRSRKNTFFKFLGPRQIDLLPFLGHGLSNDEIAAHLELSPCTIQNHRHQIMSKLGLKSRSELVLWCIQHGVPAHGELPYVKNKK